MPKTHARIFDGIKMDWLSTLFATVLGFVAAGVVSVFLILFWLDVSQQHDAVRRNYPVLGRFRGCSFIWASFSEATFLPPIGKNCPLIALSENGSTLPAAHRRKTPSLLARPEAYPFPAHPFSSTPRSPNWMRNTKTRNPNLSDKRVDTPINQADYLTSAA